MTLDQLDDDLAQLSQQYGRIPPSGVFEHASYLLKLSQTMLDRTRSPQQQTRLYYVAGQASALLAAVCFDLGSLTAAVTYARSASQYGKAVNHGPLQGFAYGMLAFMAFWDGRPTEAVCLAKKGLAFPGLGATTRRRLYAIEARGHGHQRHDVQAQRAIRDALEETGADRDELHDGIGGEFAFDDARTAMSNSTTCLLLRDAQGAEELASRALELHNERRTSDRWFVISAPAASNLARARIMAGEIEGAREALRPVLKIPVQWRGAGMLERLTAARCELTHPALRGARSAVDLAEEIEEFTALSPARRLGGTSPLAIEG
ncbi:hypothetical protein [Streptomyces zhihengii]|uniref:Transcriptional regulator n=1 Tax=Streptomyces zhihengii TaxID=1818004 RepID=A0ABS2V4G3_9ACTN|nr:hypothetical protein [Streptomyces zhihengii]MBM9624727.1 hypothetical protein [Streptomyces zhihengii]